MKKYNIIVIIILLFFFPLRSRTLKTRKVRGPDDDVNAANVRNYIWRCSTAETDCCGYRFRNTCGARRSFFSPPPPPPPRAVIRRKLVRRERAHADQRLPQ